MHFAPPSRLAPFRRAAATLLSAAVAATALLSSLPPAVEAGSTGVVTGAGAQPSTVAAGNTTAITATVSSPSPLTGLVDVEVYDPSGARALQQSFDGQTFAAGQTRAYSVPWSVPATALPGTYTVKIGVFAPGWASLYQWNDAAARVSVTASLPATTTTTASTAKDFGVNVAGAEFGESHLPGVLGTDYLYAASGSRQAYFAGQGMKLVRVPFRWERLQPSAFGPLSSADVAGLRSMLDAAQTAGQHVILDMHNHARYFGAPLTVADAAQFNDGWQKLAQALRGHPALYGYELMNEPHDLPEGADGWASLAQSATTAIRQVDTQTTILVPGYNWQGAWTWQQSNPNLHVNDPAGRLLYSAHQYFDPDGSGSYMASYDAAGAYPTIGADRVRPFLSWLAAQHARGIVTEYGIPDTDARWTTVLDTFLAALNGDANIQGGTYWAAGPWWGSYPLSVEPLGGVDRPQMAVLAKYPSHP